MDDDCCEAKTVEMAALRARHARILWVVLLINAAMFVVEFGAGVVSESSALLADSLDMLGDSLVYGFSLFVVARNLIWRARAAFLKGLVMALFGVGVFAEVVFKISAGAPPVVSTMATIATLAFVANGLCFSLLWRHRTDDINLRSTWLCSRNDLVANAAVLLAALLIAWSGSRWPDIIVGLGIATLFLRTAVAVLRESLSELAHARRDISKGP